MGPVIVPSSLYSVAFGVASLCGLVRGGFVEVRVLLVAWSFMVWLGRWVVGGWLVFGLALFTSNHLLSVLLLFADQKAFCLLGLAKRVLFCWGD